MIKKKENSIQIIGGSNEIEIRYTPSYMEQRKLIEIQRGVLRLKVKELNGYSGGYTFKYQTQSNEEITVDKIDTLTTNGYLNIEISDELQETLEGDSSYLSLKIKGVSLENIEIEESEVIVEYESKSSMLTRGVIDNINGLKSGVSMVDISTKNHLHQHEDISLGLNSDIKLMHVYNSLLKENENKEKVISNGGLKEFENLYHTGDGWKLNVEQYLYEDNTSENDKYIYIDELSRHIHFNEKYYYKEKGQKVEVKEEEVKLRADGSLYETKTGNQYKVEKRLESDSELELITNLEEIENSYIIDVKGEDLERVETEKEQLEYSIEALEDNIENNQNQIISHAIGRELKRLEAMTKEQTHAEDVNLLRISKLLYKIQKKYLEATRESSYLIGKELTEEDLVKIEGYPSYQDTGLSDETITKIREEISQEVGYLLALGTNSIPGSVDNSVRNQFYDESVYGTQNEGMIRSIVLTSIVNSVPNIGGDINRLIVEHVPESTSLARLQEREIGLQIQLLYNSNIHLRKQLSSMEKQLEKKKEELKLLENRTPIHYLKANNRILGFAKSEKEGLYRLALILDGEKATYVEYRNDKIEAIVDETGKGLQFEYEEGRLVKVSNKDGKKIRYEYEGSKLVRIRYGNNKSSEYSYNENGDLVRFISPSRYGIELEVEKGKVSKVKEISYVESLDESGVTEKEKEILKEEKIEYVSKRTICVENEYENRTTNYILDREGNIESIYKNAFIKDGEVSTVEILTHKKIGKRKSLEIASKKRAEELIETEISNSASENYLGDGSELGEIELVSLPEYKKGEIYSLAGLESKFEVELTSSSLEKIKASNNKQYVLSGWAKADSGYVARDSIGYKEELGIDELEALLEESYSLSRRYELRAELTYRDGEKKEVYTSYDYRNKEWQYNGLGVTIEDKDNLVGVKLIFDYANNIGEAKFASMSFKEGEYEYREYNEEELISYLENREYNEVYEYEDSKLVKVTRNREEESEYQEYEYDNFGNLIRTKTSEDLVKENEYDDKGELVATYAYHKDNPGVKIYEYEKKEGKEYKLNTFGKVLGEYSYRNNGVVLEEESYGYDNEGNLVSYSVGNDNNKVVYNEGLMVKQSHNDIDYNYTYNKGLKLAKIEVAKEEYLDVSYEDIVSNSIKVGDKMTTSYVNGDSYIKEYDKDSRLAKTSYKKEGVEQLLSENIYSLDGDLLVFKDYIKNGEHLYNYDSEGRVSKIDYQDGEIDNNVEYSYNDKGELIQEEFTYLDTKIVQKYKYDNKDRLEEIEVGNGLIKKVKYDELSRVIQVEYKDRYIIEYEYLTIKDHTSSLISKETLIRNNQVVTRSEYEYDDKLNLKKVIENNELVIRYEYDKINRLVREDNKKLNKSIVYSYNKGGNIENKIEYAFSLEALEEQTKLKDNIYTYKTSGNKDMLINYDGLSFEYDTLFRPTLYKGKLVEWERNNMSRYGESGYEYNGRGYRSSKTNSNIHTKYYYQGNKLKLEDNGNKLIYHYDDQGVIGFTYLGVGEYYFIKNMQGDIISIIDSNNVEIVKYVYEGYGKHKSYILNNGEYVDSESEVTYTEDGANNKMLAKINPFRYRGYYYDVDSDLYYLLTRYYDPSLSRFMSVDNLEYLDNSSLNGLNLYAYCLNNPIMYTDNLGCSAWSDFWNSIGGKILGSILTISGIVALTIATAGVGASVATSLGGGFWASVAGSVVGGAVSGAVFGAGVSVLNQGIDKGYANLSFQTVAIDTAVSATIGGVMGGLFYIGGHYSRHLSKFYPFNRKIEKTRNSIHFMFGSEKNFTIIRLGHLFRLESSARYGFHVHWISTKHRQLASIGVSAVVGGTIGAWINQLFD